MNIHFSILLPTKNRLDLLKMATQSVLEQDYCDWELIISDNCSEEDISSWVSQLNDRRILYYRHEQPLSVTENWNYANQKATGDYIIMLGDDDSLVPGALSKLARIIEKTERPELVVSSSLLYTQKNIDPRNVRGGLKYAKPVSNWEEGFIDCRERRNIVKKCCNFESSYGMNMQYYCYSRKMVSLVEKYGQFFEAPYPDYYTANMMLYLAPAVYFTEQVICIIGVTRKSYGYYYLNDNEKEGMVFHKEEDYRNYAPASIRDFLCSVDEMDTAAASTYAIVSERITEVQTEPIQYFKSVLNKEIQFGKRDIAERTLNEQMLPLLQQDERDALIQYYREIENNTNREKKHLEEVALFYDNIYDIFVDYKNVERDFAFGVGMSTNIIAKEIKKERDRESNLFLWGVGDFANELEKRLRMIDCNIYGFIDSFSQKKEVNKRPVYRPDEILDQDNIEVILAMTPLNEEVRKILESKDYSTEDGLRYKKR